MTENMRLRRRGKTSLRDDSMHGVAVIPYRNKLRISYTPRRDLVAEPSREPHPGNAERCSDMLPSAT